MRKLPSGAILPSGLLKQDFQQKMSAFNRTYANYGLKVGIVTAVYDKDDNKNINKIGPEYDVVAIEQNMDLAITALTYKNCLAADMFGAIADFLTFKRRVRTKAFRKGSELVPGEQDGALVLLLCLDGASDKAVIVGSVEHPGREAALTEEDGHALIGEFNGLGIEIDKEGALSIRFKGATDTEGNPLDGSVGGSFFKITANGSIQINDDNGQSLTLNKDNQSTTMRSAGDTRIDAGDKMDILSGADLAIKSGGSGNIEITNAATLSAKSITIDSGSAVNIEGKTLDMKIQSLAKIAGQLIILEGQTFLGAPGGTPALLLNTNFVGPGNKGAPVVSSAIGPFSSRVFISP